MNVKQDAADYHIVSAMSYGPGWCSYNYYEWANQKRGETGSGGTALLGECVGAVGFGRKLCEFE